MTAFIHIRVFFSVLVVFGGLSSAAAQWPGAGSPNPKQPSDKKYGAYTPGNAATGGDGCYFGECGDSTSKSPPAPPAPKQQPTQTGSSAPPQQMPPQQVRMSSICQTPAFWCQMFQQGVVGGGCYCNVNVPPGFVLGTVWPQP
jgi:hypothetical protein